MANVLIIGVSGAGKTTFVKTLRQPLYTQAAGIQSDTKVVVSNELLFDIDTEYYTIQVLDTPGFDDNREGQSDLDLEELILNFIKRGVTGLNLILVALPINRRYTATTLNSMVKVLEFLGPDMSQVSAILLTNAESTPDAERQAWYEKMKDIQGTDMLVEYCKLGVVYTGMYTGQEDKSSFLERQARDQRQIIQLAMNTAPIEITGDAPDIMNKFKVHESSAKDALTIKRYLPELDESLAKLRRLRFNLPSDPRMKFYSEYCARLEAEKLESKITHWNSLPELTDKFIEETQGINAAAQELRRTFGKVNVLISTTERASSIVKLKLSTGIDLDVLQKWFEEKEEASSSSSSSTTDQ